MFHIVMSTSMVVFLVAAQLPCLAATVTGSAKFADNEPASERLVFLGTPGDSDDPAEAFLDATVVRHTTTTKSDGSFQLHDVEDNDHYVCFVKIAPGASAYQHRSFSVVDGTQSGDDLHFILPDVGKEVPSFEEKDDRLVVVLTVNGAPSSEPFYAGVVVFSESTYARNGAMFLQDRVGFNLLPEGAYRVYAILVKEVNDVAKFTRATCVVELPASGKVVVELDITGEEE